MRVLKVTLGAVAIAMGSAIVLWVGYNLIWPTAEFKQHARSPFQLILPVAMIWVGWRWLTDGGPGLEAQKIGFSAPELLAATAEARRTLPRFIKDVERNVDGAFVKFPFITDTQVTEHVWAYVHAYRDRVFNVSLASKPDTQKTPVTGRRDVAESEVEDWQIMLPDGKIHGGYSISGAFRYLETKGVRLNRTMRRQKAQLVDA